MTDEAKALVERANYEISVFERTSATTCRELLDLIKTQAREIEGLRKAGRSILPYLEWTLSPESLGYHPTLPSAVYELRAALGESHDQ